MGGSSNANQSMIRNPFSFASMINAAATITGQRNHENGCSLPLTDNDMINVDKFKVS